jgi:hypothetical protein
VVVGVGGLEESLGPAIHVHQVAARLALPLVLTLRVDADAPRRARRALDLAHAHPVRLAGWIAMDDVPGSDKVRALVAELLGMAPLGVVPAGARSGADAVAHLDLPALHRALGVAGGATRLTCFIERAWKNKLRASARLAGTVVLVEDLSRRLAQPQGHSSDWVSTGNMPNTSHAAPGQNLIQACGYIQKVAS